MSEAGWIVEVPITKRDDKRRLVFGWLSVSKTKDGEYVVDHEGDIIPIDELEAAAYAYMAESQTMGDMHERTEDEEGEPLGVLVESVVFTAEKMKAMGLPEGLLPEGWWVGYRVTDEEVWTKIKDGTYKGFSIGGSATRQPV